MIYAQSNDNSGAIKTLPQPCCNRPSCQSEKPEFMKRDSFIDISTSKYMENNWEWIAYRSLALKLWRKKISYCLWSVAEVIKSIFDSLLMPNLCVATLVQSGGSLNN